MMVHIFFPILKERERDYKKINKKSIIKESRNRLETRNPSKLHLHRSNSRFFQIFPLFFSLDFFPELHSLTDNKRIREISGEKRKKN